MKSRIAVSLFLVVSILTFYACGGSSGGGGDSGGTGTVGLSLTDSSIDGLKAVYVTIDQVQVHTGGNENSSSSWTTVADPGQTYNLCELVNGVREELGLASLESGRYTQMRLIIGRNADSGINILSRPHPFANYVIDETDVPHELKVPSGFNTGFKIVQGFVINADETTELILDFDALRSVVMAGKSGKWLLKPTVRIRELEDYAILAGTVDDTDDPPESITGAMVTAQEYDASEVDEADKVTIKTGTLTDSLGYQLFIEPGTYNFVVYAEGFDPVCVQRNVAGPDEVENFTLSASSQPAIEVTGSVQISDPVDGQHATLSFRKTDVCESSSNQIIEVKSLNVADGGQFEVTLPPLPATEAYTLVVSSYGRQTERISPIDITTDLGTISLSQ